MMRRFFLLLSLSVMAACSPQQQEFAPLTGAPQVKANQFLPGDGAALPMRQWPKKIAGKSSAPNVIILALHGYNDYSHAFEDAAKYWAKHGIATYAYDQRGFGASANVGIWAGQENLQRDVTQWLIWARKTYPRARIYVLGESMGGSIAITALAKECAPQVDGLILTAPALWGNEFMPPLFRPTLWVLARTIPDMTFTGEQLHVAATDNIELLREMALDPLEIKKSRVDSLYGLVGLMDESYERAREISVPVLLLYGVKDEVIPIEPIEEVVKYWKEQGKEDFTYIRYDDGYHMLLRDKQSRNVIQDIEKWVKR